MTNTGRIGKYTGFRENDKQKQAKQLFNMIFSPSAPRSVNLSPPSSERLTRSDARYRGATSRSGVLAHAFFGTPQVSGESNAIAEQTCENQWYVSALSEEVRPDRTIPVRLFSLALVVRRDQSRQMRCTPFAPAEISYFDPHVVQYRKMRLLKLAELKENTPAAHNS